jgi:Protein-tyrosine-phosphatase
VDILFVCLGNICRSPVAACIMTAIYKERGIAGRIESAGTMDWNVGRSADHRMIRLAGERGLDLKMHRARQLSRHDFEEFDLIVVMDREIESTVLKRAPDTMRHKVKHISDCGDGKHLDVEDPYHCNEAAFRNCVDLIDRHCRRLSDEIA